jgi:hypothetical protein
MADLGVPARGAARVVDGKPVRCPDWVAVTVHEPTGEMIYVVIDGVYSAMGDQGAVTGWRRGEGSSDVTPVTFEGDAVTNGAILPHLIQPLVSSVVEGGCGCQLVTTVIITGFSPLLRECGRELDQDGPIR